MIEFTLETNEKILINYSCIITVIKYGSGSKLKVLDQKGPIYITEAYENVKLMIAQITAKNARK